MKGYWGLLQRPCLQVNLQAHVSKSEENEILQAVKKTFLITHLPNRCSGTLPSLFSNRTAVGGPRRQHSYCIFSANSFRYGSCANELARSFFESVKMCMVQLAKSCLRVEGTHSSVPRSTVMLRFESMLKSTLPFLVLLEIVVDYRPRYVLRYETWVC